MKNFLDETKKRFSFGAGEKSPYSSTTTTTTTTRRYVNGVAVEETTQTITKEESNSPTDVPDKLHDEERIKAVVEKTTQTITKKESNSPTDVLDEVHNEVHDEERIKAVEVFVEEVERQKEQPTEKQKPVEKPNKKTEERDPDTNDSTVSHQGERVDPASRCLPIVDKNAFKEHFDLTNYDFSKVDKYAKETPEEEAEDSTRLSNYLTKPWNEDLDKLRCIFIWITENISYDTDAFFSGNIQQQGPEGVLKTRRAVCDGYAGLLNKLANDAGLKVWKISGKSKGAGFKPGGNIESRQFDHAWNGTIYKGEYLLLDNTWGSGFLNGPDFEKRFEPFYFLCSPTQFIYSHLPGNPEYQYLEPKLTKEEFLSLPYVKPQFFTCGLSFIEHIGNGIEVSDDRVVIEIERVQPDESKSLLATLQWKGYDQEIPVMIQRLGTLGPKGGRMYRLLCNCPSEGEGEFSLFVMVDGNSGPMVSNFKVRNTGSGKNYVPFIETYSVPFSFTIQNPIYAELNYNDHVKFEITIFDLPESNLPQLALFLPEKRTRDLQKVSSEKDSHTFAIETCVDQKGKWSLTYCNESGSFSFIASYMVE